MRLVGAPGSWERGLNPIERKVSVCVLAFHIWGVLSATVSLVEVGGWLFVVRVSVVCECEQSALHIWGAKCRLKIFQKHATILRVQTPLSAYSVNNRTASIHSHYGHFENSLTVV